MINSLKDLVDFSWNNPPLQSLVRALISRRASCGLWRGRRRTLAVLGACLAAISAGCNPVSEQYFRADAQPISTLLISRRQRAAR